MEDPRTDSPTASEDAPSGTDGDGDPLDALLPIAAVFLLVLGGTVVAERSGSLWLGQIGVLAALGAATLFMRGAGRSWEDLGLRRPADWEPVLKWAVAGFLGIAVVTNVVMPILYVLLQLTPQDLSFLAGIRGNFLRTIVFIAGAWVLFTLPEEMLVRGFLLHRLAELVPDDGRRWTYALLGQALLFGLMNAYAGAWAFTSTTLVGLVLGWIYLQAGRNLWASVVAHGATHTVNTFLIYVGVFG